MARGMRVAVGVGVVAALAAAGAYAARGDGDGGGACDAGGIVVAATRESPGRIGRPEVAVVRAGDGADAEPAAVTGDLVATEPAVAPDGRWMALVAADGDYESAGPDATTLWRVDADGGGARALTDGTREAAPDVSPDGEQVAFARQPDGYVGEAWQVAVVPADGGEPRALFPPVRDDITATAWSPDGTQVAYTAGAGAGGGAWVVAAAGGEPRHVADVAGARWVDWADDGTLLVGTLGAEDGTIERVDVATGAVERLADHASAPAAARGGRVLYLDRRADAAASGASPAWHLAAGRLTDDGLAPDGGVAALAHPYPYGYLGLSAGPCA